MLQTGAAATAGSAAAVSGAANAAAPSGEHKAEAIANANRTKVSTAYAIASFHPSECEVPGYVAYTDCSVKFALGKHLKRPIKQLSLSKPSVRGNQCFIGSDDPQDEGRQDHFIVCVDWTAIASDTKDSGLQSVFCLDEPVRDIQWAADDLVIATTGNGTVRVLQIAADYKLVERARFTDMHFEAVREIALNKRHVGQFVTGGFDKRLCLIDINTTKRLLQSVSLEHVIGSVRWPVCNQNVCVSCTLDTGTYMVFDIRQPMQHPAFHANMGKPNLYAHERYSDHHVILGFGDGEMQHIDMRLTDRILCKTQDPYVEGIGHIDYRAASTHGAFVTSGFTDFTVWKHDYHSGQACIWSHSMGTNANRVDSSGYSTCAQFCDDSTVCTTTR